MEAAREGTPQNVSFDTPFLTGERVLSVKMNFFIEKSGNALNREDNDCSEEEHPARPLPIPPDYIDNLQSRLVKVKKGI